MIKEHNVPPNLAQELVTAIIDFGSNNPVSENGQGAVALILDKDIQALPWESLSIMSSQVRFIVLQLYTREKANDVLP